jgi:two-component system, cell cycle sensor histidine kinase and response regulator CckA
MSNARSTSSAPRSGPATSEPLRVLLVHDSPGDAQRICDELERLDRPIEFERVQDPLGLRVALDRPRLQLVISAWSLPGCGALAALDALRERGIDLPLIVVAKHGAIENAVEALRAGARDFVLEDQLERLVPVVQRELRASEERRARQRPAQAFAGSEARLRRIFERSGIGIAVRDQSGLLREANDAFLELIGYERAELAAGKVSVDLITPKEWHEAALDDEATLRGAGSVALREGAYLRKDGSRVAILIGGAVLDASEHVVYAADITERKRAEDALRSSEAQLRHAETMEAVGRLAGGIAHDFNNLMSVVLTYAALIAEDLDASDPKQEDLREVRIAAEQAAALTQQLLAFSRHQVLHPVVSDLNELLSGMVRLLQALLGSDVKLKLACASELGKVLIDPKQLAQVFMNLAISAREAMPNGGQLTLGTADALLDAEQAAAHVGLVPGRHVLLSIADTGPALDEQTRGRIFEPFFGNKAHGNTGGLGLSTAMGIVRQSGGDLWAESEPGRGTTFKIYLPIVGPTTIRPRPRRSEAPPPMPGDAARDGGNGNRDRRTVLLVEDDAKVRASTLTVLRRLGYDALEAQDGAAALALGEQYRGPIDLLLTDVVTSSMSGSELAQRMLYLYPRMKVLYLAGYAPDAVAREIALEADSECLPKPFTPEALGSTIRRVLGADS